ncbi:Store-operated calcium entry-associated regulatory factor [Golovinomyces cichoracearum]|uniref:Store-operated calcium entry-associated regulatory factor n=1 Tax=Golovinomyces cichoracearum TaxID=62708 RepID=A0A420H6U3_9PEZI|nr:Store-operated calcium entry-associated regulatory factor [Golovinomyces cichoracearum]
MQIAHSIILSLLVSTIEAAIPNDAVLLSQVRTLTLYSDAKTSHRRVPEIAQLKCKGPGCAHHQVDVMRCKNQGSAYNTEDVEWSCTASLPREFKLGSTEVICEGYSEPNDKFIFKGSCGVEYRLLLTEAGEIKFGSYKGFSEYQWTNPRILFTIFFLTILFWILYSALKAIRARNRLGRPGGFWGGGGDGYPWDSPPPYSRKGYKNNEKQTGWGPGFWTGALGGAAAGYMAGNRGTRHEPLFPERNRGIFGRSDEHNTGPSRATSGSSSSRYESTGFGSTSRR